MYNVTPLKNGLPILTSPVDGTEAVTVLVFAKAGSRYETNEERGVSHFLEHMFFKGGNIYKSTQEVSAAIDSIGGEFNAFTGKEYAGYYVKVRADDVSIACDVLSDMLLHAVFPPEDIERERGVILEEERMYQDTPMYRAGWDFEQLLYGNHPLGWDTIGTEEVIKSLKQADFQRHRTALYGPGRCAIAFSGKIAHNDSLAFGEKYFGALTDGSDRTFVPLTEFGKERVFLREKKTEQAHLVVGVPGVSALHSDHFAQKLLAVILGGNMSSRMFLRIREAKGLCYYIATEVDSYLDAGSVSTRAGVDQERFTEALTSIVHEYALCAKEGVSQDELTRAKAYLKGRITLSLEDSEERAHFFGKQLLLYPHVRDLSEYLAEIDRVTLPQVNTLAARLLQSAELRLVAIGRSEGEKELEEMMQY